ncbi:hypothetical protein NCCP2495_05370 [Dietzia sp. NCCP-2495]|uniref:phage tail family protein n=1 Tax=Dietzia sp. NCCP-2495 TaxID=2934675 RepID=UPI0022302104|nr:phage tail family protein [Dietzia sp. NCCP-2495]GLB62659.1 hypothetical protein NCCP2495_05370 [Dietzia sp. NCCP-2495]
MTGLLPLDQTLVWYMSPDGRIVHLSGEPLAGSDGVWLGPDPDGLGSAEVESLFEAAARQSGETWIGTKMGHGTIDLQLYVEAESADAFRRRWLWLSNLIERRRPGWLLAYTSATGWRWLAVRKESFKPALGRDPGPRNWATFDLLLIVESPLAREADDTDEWINAAGSGRGDLYLYPGDSEWPPWPQFVLRGPGRFRLRWAGNDVEFPMLRADEWALVNTDEARPTIRARDINGVDRNLWPEMKPGTKIEHPLRPREVSRVDVKVTGGSSQSSAWGTVAVQREGLV